MRKPAASDILSLFLPDVFYLFIYLPNDLLKEGRNLRPVWRPTRHGAIRLEQYYSIPGSVIPGNFVQSLNGFFICAMDLLGNQKTVYGDPIQPSVAESDERQFSIQISPDVWVIQIK